MSVVGLWVLLCGLAQATNPYEGRETDVIAHITFDGDVEQTYEQLIDVNAYSALFPAPCGRNFEPGLNTTGLGATLRYTHVPGPWKRTLPVTITRANVKGHMVEYDHGGDNGFITRFIVSEKNEQVTVKMISYVGEPPWIARSIYFDKVQPAWTTCQEAMLANLRSASAASPAPAE